MSRARVRFINVLIGVLVAGSGVAAWTGRELWPFSPYPMYAWVERAWSVSRLQLYGVRDDGSSGLFPLAALRYLRPFDDARLYSALARLRQRDGDLPLQEALRYCLMRYEDLRRQGRHDGPLLQALQLQLIEWDHIDPWARTRETPDRRWLVSEVRLPALD